VIHQPQKKEPKKKHSFRENPKRQYILNKVVGPRLCNSWTSKHHKNCICASWKNEKTLPACTSQTTHNFSNPKRELLNKSDLCKKQGIILPHIAKSQIQLS
jgi:hypothetical protein